MIQKNHIHYLDIFQNISSKNSKSVVLIPKLLQLYVYLNNYQVFLDIFY